jgi:hypothetical protein
MKFRKHGSSIKSGSVKVGGDFNICQSLDCEDCPFSKLPKIPGTTMNCTTENINKSNQVFEFNDGAENIPINKTDKE